MFRPPLLDSVHDAGLPLVLLALLDLLSSLKIVVFLLICSMVFLAENLIMGYLIWFQDFPLLLDELHYLGRVQVRVFLSDCLPVLLAEEQES